MRKKTEELERSKHEKDEKEDKQLETFHVIRMKFFIKWVLFLKGKGKKEKSRYK